MKNTILLAAATLLISAAQAQDTNATMGNSVASATATATDTTKKLNAYGSYSTRDSIAAKYKLLPMPAPLTLEKTFPVLGSYQLSTTAGTTATTATEATDSVAAPMVTVTIDSVSKGIVWIEGLPQGKMRAFLKKSPTTYRIIAQKTQSGTSIPEGTLYMDPETNILNIVLGAPYNEADPISVFALSAGTTADDNTAEVKVKTKNTKIKSKLQFYTATKVDPAAQSQDAQNATGTFNESLQRATDSQQ